MHPEARAFHASILEGRHFHAVIEVGSRKVNGGVRDLFTCDEYTGLDLEPGPGVDVVTDCRDWTPPEPVDAVLCAEVLEHAPDPAGVVKTCISYLAPGGLLVLSCAGPGRAPHSGHDGMLVRPDEHYANILPNELEDWLAELDDVTVTYAAGPADLYAVGTKGHGEPAPEPRLNFPARFTTDKATTHGYLPTYLRLASHIGTTGRICEIGVQHGDSLRMWQALFPDGLIVGVDNDPKARWPDGTHRIVAEQDDENLPARLAEVMPAYDLIVDDASHIGQLSQRTWKLLWPLVAPGGWYILEDWMVGFDTWDGYDNSMLRLAESFLHALDRLDSQVESVEYRYGLAIIRKREER